LGTHLTFFACWNSVDAVKAGSSRLNAATIAGIVIGVLVVLLIGLATALYALRQRRRAAKAASANPFASWGAGGEELGEAPKLKGARWFSLAELKLATDDWSKDNEIGRGGYGIVYKGVLKSGKYSDLFTSLTTRPIRFPLN
jgi:hypothetical protein